MRPRPHPERATWCASGRVLGPCTKRLKETDLACSSHFTECLAPPFGTRERATIALVGGGAASTAFLWSLVKKISADPLAQAPEVLVFEPASPCGPGVAYREDVEVALLNRPVSAMSVDYADRGHFRRWLGEHEPQVDRDAVFAPRASFGRYLADTFRSACADLRNMGGAVRVLRETVHEVRPAGGQRAIVTAEGAYGVDDVVMCVGALPARDVCGLGDFAGYVHHPYPVQQLVETVPDGADVLVLGTGLTAVDVALALGRRRRPVHVTLASRTGALPDVRCDLGAGDCAPDLIEDLRTTLARNPVMDLADLARLLDAELERSGSSLREALWPFLAKVPGEELLRSRLAEPGPAGAVQRCIVALTPWYSHLWRSLDSKSSKDFLRRYGRIFTCLRSPMPPVNARRLLELADAGVLSFRSGISGVTGGFPGFRARFAGDARRFDVVVNATGRGIDLGAARSGSMVDSLVAAGHARPHPLGGLDVHPDSNEILDARGMPVPAVHVIGDLSSGVHFHVSSMEYVATQAGRVADRVVSRLPAQEGVLL